MHASDPLFTPLEGGDLLLVARRSLETFDMYRLSGPGKLQRLGSPALPLAFASVSSNLERAVAVQNNYSADGWMYDIVKR